MATQTKPSVQQWYQTQAWLFGASAGTGIPITIRPETAATLAAHFANLVLLLEATECKSLEELEDTWDEMSRATGGF